MSDVDVRVDLGFEEIVNGNGIIDDADELLELQEGIADDGKGDD